MVQRLNNLVPDKNVVRQRLRENLVENRLLRRLLRISEAIDHSQLVQQQIREDDGMQEALAAKAAQTRQGGDDAR